MTRWDDLDEKAQTTLACFVENHAHAAVADALELLADQDASDTLALMFQAASKLHESKSGGTIAVSPDSAGVLVAALAIARAATAKAIYQRVI